MNSYNLKAYHLVIFFGLLTACASTVPRKDLQNLPTLIEIVALNFNNNSVKLRVSHRNRTTREQNQLNCQLTIKDHTAVQLSVVPVPDLTTYAVETIDIATNLSQVSQTAKLHKELPYVLDCFLSSANFRKEQITSKSIIYQIPGETHIYR